MTALHAITHSTSVSGADAGTSSGAGSGGPARSARTALRVVNTAQPAGAPVVAPGPGAAVPATAPHAEPSRVRALPVPVPARRRPVVPVRGAGRGAGRLAGVAGAEAAPAGALWVDVRPWGDEVRGRRAARPESRPLATPAARPVARPEARPEARPLATPAVRPSLRAVMVFVVLALIGSAAWLGVTLAGGSSPLLAAPPTEAAQTAMERVAVAPGETLWQIAAAYAPEGSDVRDTVTAIALANGLSGGQVQAGQVLEIPAPR